MTNYRRNFLSGGSFFFTVNPFQSGQARSRHARDA
jgi:hypothetical protein